MEKGKIHKPHCVIGAQMTPHSGYRGPSHHSMAGDSGYFHSGSRSAKSYSDTDFGLRHTTASSHMPYSMTPQTYQISHAMHVSLN